MSTTATRENIAELLEEAAKYLAALLPPPGTHGAAYHNRLIDRCLESAEWAGQLEGAYANRITPRGD